MKITDPDTVEQTAVLWETLGHRAEAACLRESGIISLAGGGRPRAKETQDQKLAVAYAWFIEKWHAYWEWDEAVKFACLQIDVSTKRQTKKGVVETTDGFTNLQEMIAGRRPRAQALLEQRVWVFPKYAQYTKSRKRHSKTVSE
jgi:hypothetical protein